MLDADGFQDGLRRRNVRALARMITLAENNPREAYRVLAAAVPAAPAAAHVLGVTGPPGVGKSSLVNALIGEFRSDGRTVAVLAVDPSSPFAGGALLGDRVRMNAHAGDPGVYIRSMATRGVLGGLSRAAWLAVRVLTAWGFDWIVIETAGVGQSEIDIVDLAETTLLVLSPALGDDVQVMKAGIMEVADLFVINKSDLPGAERVRNSLASILARADEGAGAPSIFQTVATAARSESGAGDLAAWLRTRSDTLRETEQLDGFRSRRRRIEVRQLALSLLGTVVDGRVRGDAGAHDDPFGEAMDIVERIVRDDVWRSIDVHAD